MSIDFDKNFPKLVQHIKSFEESVGLGDLQEEVLNYESDKLTDAINRFYSSQMMPIIESVDDELFAFLGPYWTVLKKQNEGKIAIQTVLVL